MDVWEDRAFYDDGEWVTWSEIEEYERRREWGVQWPHAYVSLIPVLDQLLDAAERYFMDSGTHLNVYGAIGELVGAVSYGIALHQKNNAQGSDGRLGKDFVEIKTISPNKRTDLILVKRAGNFNKLLVVKIGDDFGVEWKLVDRSLLKGGSGKYYRVRWSQLGAKTQTRSSR